MRLKARWMLGLLLAVFPAGAEAFPQFLLYQGRYTSDGAPSNGNVSMEFRVTKNAAAVACGTSADANLFWTSGSTAVATVGGLFSYKLGLKQDGISQDGDFLNINWNLANTTYYIDVCVSGTSLSPKEPIGSSVFSIVANTAVNDTAELNTFASSKTFISSVTAPTFYGSVNLGQGPMTVDLINRSGGALAAGAVVIADTTGNLGVTTIAGANDLRVIGVVAVGGANLATVRVAVMGIIDVTTNGTVDIGDCLRNHTVAGQASSVGNCSGVSTGGTFAVALTASAGGVGTVKALLTGVNRP